jgi:hypothetical protein
MGIPSCTADAVLPILQDGRCAEGAFERVFSPFIAGVRCMQEKLAKTSFLWRNCS